MDDTFGMLSRLTWPAVLGLVAILFLLIIVVIIKRLGGARSSSEGLIRQSGLDLIDLKKKGLLTPEELERVGKSMVKQMELKEQALKRKSSVPDPQNLLLDPEVRRLEVLAAAAKRQPKSPAPIDGIPNPNPDVQINSPVFSEEEIDQVELPLDVQQMVDAGLLVPEEVRNIKRRLLDRTRQ